MQFELNGKSEVVPELWTEEPLLHVLREHFKLTGAKFGCGVGICGACTVIIDGEARRSCQVAAKDLANAKVQTIEGLANGETLHPLQQAWLELGVPQCGYCQAGQIMSAAALLASTPHPTDPEIAEAMEGNLCRCGTYGRIRAAISRVAASNP
jgi:isoquinoline 1-oxidoreductase subunit alpha